MSQPEHGASTVEACSWDLTMGAANLVIGKLFLRSTSSSSDDTPEAIDHVGIVVFNRLYEYGHNGIKKSNVPRNGDDPIPQYPGCKLRKREYLGRTTRTRHEFMEWIVNVKYGDFRGSTYDMIYHNCLDFAKAVCVFLEVPPNPNWEKITNWAKNNQKFAGLFNRGGVPGVGVGPSTSGAASSSNGFPRRSRSLQQNGRSMTIPEEGPSSRDESGQSGSNSNDSTPEYSAVVSSSPRRRRFSMNPNPPIASSGRSHSRFSFRSRSASLETLPPTYEEALKMSSMPMPRKDSIRSAAPSYDSLIRMSATAANNNSSGNSSGSSED